MRNCRQSEQILLKRKPNGCVDSTLSCATRSTQGEPMLRRRPEAAAIRSARYSARKAIYLEQKSAPRHRQRTTDKRLAVQARKPEATSAHHSSAAMPELLQPTQHTPAIPTCAAAKHSRQH